MIQLNKTLAAIDYSDSKTTLSFTSGNTEQFDYLLITVPLGCLQHKTISFNPPLPSRLDQAISSLGYGNLEKVYFRYPKPWWPLDGAANYTFLEPTYDARNLSKQLIEVMSLAHLKSDAQPILLFFVYEPLSSWLADSPPQKEIIDFFEPYIKRIPVCLIFFCLALLMQNRTIMPAERSVSLI